MKEMKEPNRIVMGIILVFAVGVVFSGFLIESVPKVRIVTDDDPTLQASVRLAQQTLPAFDIRVKEARKGDSYFVRAKFKTPFGPEYLWVRKVEKQGVKYSGVLDQSPASVPKIVRGDKIEIEAANVVDWAIKSADGKIEGASTEFGPAASLNRADKEAEANPPIAPTPSRDSQNPIK